MDERLLDVNEHGVLRIPSTLWLSLVLLVRHWLWSIFILLSAQYGGAASIEAWHGSSFWPLIAQLPAVVLILAAGRRMPEAGKPARVVWAKGAWLVGVTTCLNLAWTIGCLSMSSEWRLRPELILVCFSLLDLAIARDLCLSRYAKQVFAEFPEPPLSKKF